MATTILLVEDEEVLISYLSSELSFEEYQVIEARDGVQALALFEQHQDEISLIVLDWMLPQLDGLEVLRRIRKTTDVPVIMMTARDYVGDKVAGLDAGADDYITKPFEIEELLARIRVIIRRSERLKHAESQKYELSDLSINSKTRQVRRGEHMIQLTQREYELLLTLVQHRGEVLTRDELLDLVWGVDFVGQINVVDVYIRYLRNKIDQFGDQPLIETIRGVGYRLRDDQS